MVNKRFAHKIKDNKGSAFPERYIFFDTETFQVPIGNETYEHRLRLGVACYWRWRRDGNKSKEEYLDFTTQKTFWDWVDSKVTDGKRLILVAHNIQFDFKVMGGFQHLKRRGWRAHKFILNGTTNIWEFKKDKRTIMCLDNMNYFTTSLASLGESIGIPKMTMPEFSEDNDVWFPYCRRDVDVMLRAWEMWLKFLRDNDLGNFARTVASQAFNAYRHRFMPVPIMIHDNEAVTELERKAYYGGRVESFSLGTLPKKDYYSLDVNSMYPHVMRTFEYPSKLVKLVHHPSVPLLEKALKDYCVIAEVDINTKERIYPTRFDNKLLFPIGRFRTSLTTRELIRAVEKGDVEQVISMSIYEKGILFKEYVDFFYLKRNEYKKMGNDAFQFMTKIMLNSLYGKFGQRNEIYEEVGYDETLEDHIVREWDYSEGKFIKWRVISGLIEQFVGLRESANSFPAIPAHITADARLLLYDYITIAGWRNVFYCDTDSLFTNNAGKKKLESEIDATKLGKLDIEKHSSRLTIHGLKDYEFGDEIKIKGIRKGAEKIGKQTYKQLQFQGLKTSLREGRTDRMTMKYIKKTLKRNYNKGIIQANGRVKPYTLKNNFLDALPKPKK